MTHFTDIELRVFNKVLLQLNTAALTRRLTGDTCSRSGRQQLLHRSRVTVETERQQTSAREFPLDASEMLVPQHGGGGKDSSFGARVSRAGPYLPQASAAINLHRAN